MNKNTAGKASWVGVYELVCESKVGEDLEEIQHNLTWHVFSNDVIDWQTLVDFLSFSRRNKTIFRFASHVPFPLQEDLNCVIGYLTRSCHPIPVLLFYLTPSHSLAVQHKRLMRRLMMESQLNVPLCSHTQEDLTRFT